MFSEVQEQFSSSSCVLFKQSCHPTQHYNIFNTEGEKMLKKQAQFLLRSHATSTNDSASVFKNIFILIKT